MKLNNLIKYKFFNYNHYFCNIKNTCKPNTFFFLDDCDTFLKTENNSPRVNFTHLLEKNASSYT